MLQLKGFILKEVQVASHILRLCCFSYRFTTNPGVYHLSKPLLQQICRRTSVGSNDIHTHIHVFPTLVLSWRKNPRFNLFGFKIVLIRVVCFPFFQEDIVLFRQQEDKDAATKDKIRSFKDKKSTNIGNNVGNFKDHSFPFQFTIKLTFLFHPLSILNKKKMIQSTDIPVAEEVIPVNTNYDSFITAAFLFQSVGRSMFNVAAILHGLALAAPLGRLRNNYLPPGAFDEEVVVMPPSTLSFILTALLAFVDMKSQGNPEFPFQTHPQAIMVSVTSLIMYGLVSAAELVVPGARKVKETNR